MADFKVVSNSWSLLGIATFSAATVVFGSQVHAHGDAAWIMRNQLTAWCCGPQDCGVIEGSEVRLEDGQWFVRGRPVDKVYPTQPGGGVQFWACFNDPPVETAREPRCLFLPSLF